MNKKKGDVGMKIYYQEGSFKIPVNARDYTKSFQQMVEELLSEIRKTLLENSVMILYTSRDGELSLEISFEDKAKTEQSIKTILSNFFMRFPPY